MAKIEFTFPEEVNEWASLLLGAWLCVSPFILAFSGDAAATQNAIAVGFLVIISGVFTYSRLPLLQEWINIALGIWLIASVSILGSAGWAAKADFIVVGLLLIGLDAYELWRKPERSVQ